MINRNLMYPRTVPLLQKNCCELLHRPFYIPFDDTFDNSDNELYILKSLTMIFYYSPFPSIIYIDVCALRKKLILIIINYKHV